MNCVRAKKSRMRVAWMHLSPSVLDWIGSDWLSRVAATVSSLRHGLSPDKPPLELLSISYFITATKMKPGETALE